MIKNILWIFLFEYQPLFAQLKCGVYSALPFPEKVMYRLYKDSTFSYFSQGDIADFKGVGIYKIEKDSILFKFNVSPHPSIIHKSISSCIQNEYEYHISIRNGETKEPLCGMEIRFFSKDTLCYKGFSDVNGELNYKNKCQIKKIILSYIGERDLILYIDSTSYSIDYNIDWLFLRCKSIDGETWKYKLQDVRSNGFTLQKGAEVIKYRRNGKI